MEYHEARKGLIEELIREGVLKTQKVIEAMKKVPRELFVREEYKSMAYVDTPLPIGYGQTISAPSMVALMTEELSLDQGLKVLEIGTGSGYQAAIIAEIVKPEGHVWSIEIIPQIAEFARRNLKRSGYIKYVTVIVGDGSKGYPQQAPFDRIIVTAASPSIPSPLIEQLKPGGIMVIPVGSTFMQVLKVIIKRTEVDIDIRDSVPCVFVPLVGEYGFKH